MSISPLSDATYDGLRALIDGGRMARDARLPGENDLATRFGVSRPVVRQALSRLRAEGRVYARKGAGNFVGEPPVLQEALRFGPLQNVPDVHGFLDFRCVLEGEAAARAALCRDPELLRQIRARRRALEAAAARGEPAIEEDIAFHDAIAQACGNRFLMATLSALREQRRVGIALIRQLSPQAPITRSHDVHREHRAIDEAIARGDAEAARAAMTAHLRGGMKRLFGG